MRCSYLALGDRLRSISFFHILPFALYRFRLLYTLHTVLVASSIGFLERYSANPSKRFDLFLIRFLRIVTCVSAPNPHFVSRHLQGICKAFHT